MSLATRLGDPQSVADTVSRYVDDPERVLAWGYRTYHRAADGVSAVQLAADAARKALAAAGVEAGDIDYLVVADSNVPDHLNWDMSTAVAREAGLSGAPTLLLTQACASGVTAFERIAGILAVRPDVRTVLLVTVNRVSEQHSNRMRTNTCLGSDGSAAAVLRRGERQLRWLGTEQISDPECADFFRIEYGGAAAPRPPEGESNLTVDPLALVYRHFRKDPEHLTAFVRSVNARVAQVIDRACERAGVPRQSLARVVYLNDNQKSMKEMARAVGIGLDRTNAELAAELGHCGGADQLICLQAHRERGELRPGDVVALAGLATGMHWFCTLIEV
ncbi:3-oxoacyl-ACP synthase III family protein [Streptomyces sp. NPDC051041]|uniref:3-oxoacyl-ACP synthase III family protein n=1 Tax=Streptomyces sp. NPDC051041 TaxID=3365640 RepID=UPI0037B04331